MCAFAASRARRSRITKLFAAYSAPAHDVSRSAACRRKVPGSRATRFRRQYIAAQDACRMRALFVHQNFPAQYRHVAPALARRPDTRVLALGENEAEPLPGVQHLRYKAPPTGAEGTHRYLRRLENATFRGQQVARAALALKERGFSPDVLCCHPGWGEGLFLRDVWPEARMLYYYEYYYASAGGDVGFDPPGAPVQIDD